MVKFAFFPLRPISRPWTALHSLPSQKIPEGNYFATREDGAVWFWDHETDDLVPLASSVSEFVTQCTDPALAELNPRQVKSVWINPEFAKSRGMKVPEDG
jgi:hypothetical protein